MNLASLLAVIEELPAFPAALRRLSQPADRVPIVLSEGAKPALVAALARALAVPIVVVGSRSETARRLADQIAVWTPDPDAVVYSPEPSGLPFEDLPTDPMAAQDRLEILTRLRQDGRPPIVVTSIHAALHKVIGPDALGGAQIELKAGSRLSPVDLAARLVELGYEVEAIVDRPGTFSRRGGILDVAPPTSQLPVRIEFFGDQVDTLREFSPETQRSTRLIETATIGPASELQVRPRDEEVDRLLSGLDFSECPPELAADWAAALRRQLANPQTLSGQFVGLLNRHSLIDHLPPEAVIVVDEAWAVDLAARGIWRQGQEIAAGRREKGTLPTGLPAPILSPEEWQERLTGRRVATIAMGEVETSPKSKVQSPKSGDDPDFVTDAKSRRRQGPRAAQSTKNRGDSAEVEAQARAQSPDFGPWTLDLGLWTSSDFGLRLPIRPPAAFAGRPRDLGRRLAELREMGAGVVLVSQQAPRLAELYRDDVGLALLDGELERCPESGQIVAGMGSLAEGIELRREDGRVALAVLTDAEIFGVSKVRRPVRARRTAREDHLADINEGDYVVHIEHGVGKFEGLRRRTLDGQAKEYLVLSYAENDKLYVPVDQANRVARYIGARDEAPRLTRLGGTEWARAKERVKKAVKDIAADLLRIYAARQVRPGHAYPPDSTWQIEMEQSFPYVETPDQLVAVESVKEDLEAPRPMDRLICGDVGYGKTEVALRAAFKVVQDGKQVVVLVPTTVLAQQHFRTFSERLAAFPVKVAMLSRFLTDKEAAGVVAGLKDGSIDICIGTHRLLQADVVFKDPGLLIVDEEQRFGVLHKEQLKRLRTEIDVLTMTATPIPRTLYQALVGARDMSTIETPPEERLPVRTYLAQFDEEIVRQAILRELDRGGQVYFVHNRVRSIGILAHQLMDLVPEATFGIGHGQMHEEALEQVMTDFGDGKIDVLVCSTIIESGLDIPNVNTIIINQANRLGLSQLYQLRGRVGRSSSRAYAYLLYDKDARLTPVAEQRLRAIFAATELGSGFRIAQRDLEIRGAGNLLGSEQSGHVSAVGFDLYTRLLAEAIADLKGEPVPDGAGLPDPAGGPTLDLGMVAHLPREYIAEDQLRLVLYRRIAGLATPEAVDRMTNELYDRFGPIPEVAQNLLQAVKLKALAAAAGVSAIQMVGSEVVLQADSLLAGRREEVSAVLRGKARVGATQVRLERSGKWLERLEDVLIRLAGPSAQPAGPARPTASAGSASVAGTASRR